MIQSFENSQSLEWERTRNIELANYASTVGINGKQAFKLKSPTDLYKLPTDVNKLVKNIKIDKDRQKKSVESMKSTKEFTKWEKNNIKTK